MKQRIRFFYFWICALVLLGMTQATRETFSFVVSHTQVTCADLPEEFQGFRIVQIADLHEKSFGINNETLLAAVRDASPDLIALTGDTFETGTNVRPSLSFVEKLCSIAPVYFVSGNHEAEITPTHYEELCAELRACGVTILSNRKVSFLRGNASITLAGLEDPNFYYYYGPGVSWKRHARGCEPEMDGTLRAMRLSPDSFVLLLSHRPEFLNLYANRSVDLVLSGHTHGGQIRFPSLGALYAPGQGLFPEISAGLFEKNGTQLYVSRGFGGTLRFHCVPELAVLTLHRDA